LPGLPRDWKPNFVGNCIIFTTQGFDYFWASVLLPIAAIIAGTMFLAITIGNGVRRDLEAKKQSLQLVSTDPMQPARTSSGVLYQTDKQQSTY
jgi:hypothetical protein